MIYDMTDFKNDLDINLINYKQLPAGNPKGDTVSILSKDFMEGMLKNKYSMIYSYCPSVTKEPGKIKVIIKDEDNSIHDVGGTLFKKEYDNVSTEDIIKDIYRFFLEEELKNL